MSTSLASLEWWDLQRPALPARSRLYPLEPLGLATPAVESLTSYITRLAEAHSAPVGKLVKREILPRFGRPSLLANLTPFWTYYARALNGINTWAQDLVAVLQPLTRRPDLGCLTLLPWSAVLSPYGLLRHHRAWCAGCLAAWRQADQTVYEPLLWSLAVVNYCPTHQQWLQHRCPHCRQILPWLAAKMRPGFCPRCHGWLGQPPGHEITYVHDVAEAEQAWQTWTVMVIGELLAAAPTLSKPPERARVAQNLSRYIGEVAAGKPGRFFKILQAHHVHLTYTSLYRWQTGEILPNFNTFLELCYCLGTSLLRFLTTDTITVPTRLNLLRGNRSDG